MDPLELNNVSASPEAEETYVLPASFGQERFWDLDRLNPGNPTWNVPVRFRLQGSLDPLVLERAFNEIVRRHEVLRTTFALVEGHPAQVIAPSLNIKVPVTDLRHLAKAERDAEVDRLSLREARFRFDLTAGPLFRVGLLRTEENEHILLVNPHHSVVDYWSVGIISNELGALYDAYSRGQESSLPELAIQYADYAVWQREQSGSETVRKELAYWTEQLKALPQLEFPTDRPRPAFPTYDATITSILLPTTLTDQMKELANHEETTFFNAMLAALSILTYQYTGQVDFGVATQVGGRTSVEVESLVGLFINTVVLRPNLAGDPTFSQLLSRVREVGTQSIVNNSVRFEQLLKKLRPDGYPSHHTLFRLNFICQRDPVKPLEFAGIKLTVIPSKSQGALYDLHVFLIMRNEGWRLACEYNIDLFDAETIVRLLAGYRMLLEQIVEDPGRRVSEFAICEGATIAKQKKHDEVSSASKTDGVITGDSFHPRSLGAAGIQTLELLEQDLDSVETDEDPSVEPFVMPTSVAQQRFWVLEEIAPGNPALHMRACVRANGQLRLDLLERSLQLLVDRHEILRTTFGKVDEELVQVIAPSQVITLPVISLESMSATDREAGLWRVIRSETSAPFDLEHGPLMRARLIRLDRQEYVLVITTHHILVDGWSQSVIQRDLWSIYEGLSDGHKSPLSPLAIQYGDFVHWQQEWLASENCKKELQFWTKQLAAPVPVLNFPTDRPARNRPSSKGAMETLLLPEDLVRPLKSLSQSQEVTMFMLTLAAFGALLHRYAEQDDFVIGSPVANRKPETEPLIGPFSGPISLRFNLSGNPTLGELLVRVREMTLEALSHADLPFEVLHDKLEVRSVHGRNPLSQCYFFYQTAFLQPRNLPDVTVTPLPDFALGTHFELQLGLLERREGLRAQLEYNPDLFESATIKQVLVDFRQILGTMIENLDRHIDDLAIPVIRRQTAAAEVDSPVDATALLQDETEKQLAGIWEKVLGIKSIGPHQNYFELGGTSLLAVRLFTEVEKVFKVKIPLAVLFEAQTVAALARILREGVTSAWSSLVEIQPRGDRPPFFCMHGGGGNVLIYRDLSRHLGPEQPFYGLQSQGLDGARSYLNRIEEMASLYVKEIKMIQPRGPYFLGGYCMGGTVAYETAQQLTAAGEEVALLALFDTLNWVKIPAGSFVTRLFYQTQRLIFHAGNFLLLNFKDKVKFFREKTKVLRDRSSVWQGILFGKIMKKHNGEKPESLILAEIWEINDRAILNYVPRPYPGVVTDFRPMKQYLKYGSDSHWDDLAVGGQHVITLPVYPAGMLLEPFVKDLAKVLRRSIDEAISASPGAAEDSIELMTNREDRTKLGSTK